MDEAGLEIDAGAVMLCCRSPAHDKIARAASARQSPAGQQAAVDAVRAIAAEMHVGLTPHAIVVARSQQAVHLIGRQVNDAQRQGDLKEWTREYKAARVHDPTLTFARFMQAEKIALVVATAMRMRLSCALHG